MRKSVLWRVRTVVTVSTVAIGSVVMLVFAQAAGAHHLGAGMSISASGSVKLVNGVYLVVPVSVKCPDPALSPTQFIQEEQVVVNVEEKTGKSLALGRGSIGYSDQSVFGGQITGTPFVCDGTAHIYSINVFPIPTSDSTPALPFKGGKAVATTNFDLFVQDTNTFQGDDNFVTGGPQSISIKG